MSNGIFRGRWTDTKSVLEDFQAWKDGQEINADTFKGEILFAAYYYEDYSGRAFVLYREEGKLYEVNGSHCSCNGLEGQWSPEEVVIEEICKRFGDQIVERRDPEFWRYGGMLKDEDIEELVKLLGGLS